MRPSVRLHAAPVAVPPCASAPVGEGLMSHVAGAGRRPRGRRLMGLRSRAQALKAGDGSGLCPAG